MKKAAFWSALLTLTVLSLIPTGLLPSQVFSLWDKAQHALGFLVLAVLGLAAYPRHTVWVPLLLLAHGGLIELAQGAAGWRHGDLIDWLADAIGIAFGTALWLWRSRLRPST